MALALPASELPTSLLDGPLAKDRVHCRGGESEVRFYWRDRPALLRVWWGGRVYVVRWGNRDRAERKLPPTGWTWRAAVVAVWLGDKAFDKHKEYLPRISKSLTFEATQLAAFDGDKAGPAGWEVNADAHLTVVVTHKGRVVKSFAFVSVDETDVQPVVVELKKAIDKK